MTFSKYQTKDAGGTPPTPRQTLREEEMQQRLNEAKFTTKKEVHDQASRDGELATQQSFMLKQARQQEFISPNVHAVLSEIKADYVGLKSNEEVFKDKVDGGGLRFNKGKLPMELVPSSVNLSLARVLQAGAKKYAKNNWRLGMDWTIVMGCIERHYNAFKLGEDIDPETGLRHIELLLCNVAFLNEYFYTHPKLDDRFKNSPESIDKILGRIIK